ncbi:S24/S26 family peptidase [Curtobacterium sp. MCPF17_002]|uniref:S24/S26 family peptidase n=1 Tax=Curtobacterium sp. MCPF17_002 TaxID=2175645 RepID=UPI000DA8E982|nr:S24/S26 family peptidase [Curtobacterium sp. MCPF17_002]WIB78175.1 S24/S26 family peptidase [Curtobacterium sp. MCPF17_002]
MASIAVHGGPTPHDVLRDAVDWGRVVVATLARGVVATLLGLALWAAAPAVIGWQPTTVMTGSMEPRLTPGDVVVSRPVSAGEVRMGKILLADDPDQPGHLRMHRYVDDGPDGTLVTKGDANPQQDSTPLERSAVHGVAFLRVPFVGTPITWIRTGQWMPVGMLALALVAVLALCTIDGSLRRFAGSSPVAPTDDGDGDGGDGDGGGDGADDGLEARDGAAPRLPSDPAPVRSRHVLRRQARRVRRLRRLGGAAAVLVVAGGLGVLLPEQAVAVPWSQTTVNPRSSFGAATAVAPTALGCTNNADHSVNITFTPPAGTTATYTVIMNGNTVVTSGTGSPIRVAGSGILSLGAVVTITVRTELGSNWTATSTSSTKIQTALVGTNLTCG